MIGGKLESFQDGKSFVESTVVPPCRILVQYARPQDRASFLWHHRDGRVEVGEGSATAGLHVAEVYEERENPRASEHIVIAIRHVVVAIVALPFLVS